MGKIDERNTPLFNLKRDYKFDLDRNSGLNKTFLERCRDSVADNLPQWIVGTHYRYDYRIISYSRS